MADKTAKKPRVASYDVPALRKAIRLMEYLCESPEPKGVSDIVKELDLNNNMVFRMLRTLEEEGWVVQAEAGPKFAMSLMPFHHLSKPVRRMSLYSAAKKPMHDLWKETGESIYLGVTDDTRTLFLEHLDARGDIRITASPGGRFRMHCAAPGKVLMAFTDDDLVDRVAKEGLPAQTKKTITKLKALRTELEQVRKQGYALDLEEYADGLQCFAAPIFDVKGDLAGTIGLSVLTLYYTKHQLVTNLGPKVIAAADAISTTLGHVAAKE